MKKRIDFGYFVVEGARSIVSHRLMSFAAVCMIVACLVIMGAFSMVALNADRVMGQFEDENEFLAYIDEAYTDEQIAQLQKQVEAMDNVASVTFITKEEARATYLEGHENDGLYQSLPDTVFRDRFSIHVKDLEQFDATVTAVAQLPGIADYAAAPEIADGLVMVRNGDSGGHLPVYHCQHHQAGHVHPEGRNRHHEDVRRHQLVCPLAFCD